MATILGCPVSSYLALVSACQATAVPTCATATPSTAWNAACCTSLSAYGVSVGSCFLKNAPTCLDTNAAASTLAAATGGAAATNVCAQYFVGGGGAAPATTAAVGGASTAAAATATSGAGGAGGATGTSSAASAGTTAKSAAAPQMQAGLKVYLGVVLLGSLAVLAM